MVEHSKAANAIGYKMTIYEIINAIRGELPLGSGHFGMYRKEDLAEVLEPITRDWLEYKAKHDKLAP